MCSSGRMEQGMGLVLVAGWRRVWAWFLWQDGAEYGPGTSGMMEQSMGLVLVAGWGRVRALF